MGTFGEQLEGCEPMVRLMFDSKSRTQKAADKQK